MSRGKTWKFYGVLGKFRLRENRIRRAILRARPDDGSDQTSMDTAEFTMFINFRKCCLVDLLEQSIVIINIYGVSVQTGQVALRNRDQHITRSHGYDILQPVH